MPQSDNLGILLLSSFILFNLFLSSMLILGVEQFVQALSEILCKSIRPFPFGGISSFLGETCVLARALCSVLCDLCSLFWDLCGHVGAAAYSLDELLDWAPAGTPSTLYTLDQLISPIGKSVQVWLAGITPFKTQAELQWIPKFANIFLVGDNLLVFIAFRKNCKFEYEIHWCLDGKYVCWQTKEIW